ncbi:MFS transporter [Clostridium sp. 19966]|uniref:MFS transporter n=1 Tax=Clostridium sp. 19966 TaxID=2768166 RepID=UPI0028F142F8|nr:MFS transporter [Clostridium sp. 19966]
MTLEEEKINSKSELNNLLILVMAAACGIVVANLYYIQPLLVEIGKTFKVSELNIGFSATLTQIGYAVGMLFLLPLADIREKRSLISIMLLCSAFSLTLMFFSPSIEILMLACFAIGFTSVVPQLIVPLAAQLANPNQRGKVIGSVMSGLLIGILVSRTFSGLVGGYLGWRTVYVIAAVMMIILALFLRKLIPICPPVSQVKYSELFKSMAYYAKNEPSLVEASINGAMMFGAFSAFWTCLVFLLGSSHYNMGSQAAGLFGLVGIIGASAAPVAGRLSDKKSPRFTIAIGMAIVGMAYIVFLVLGFKLWGLILGVILLDLGVQSCQISNQTRVHAISEEARNRVNTVFMVSYFAGGALGSFFGSLAYSHFGWYGVCVFGLITQIIAIAVHVIRGNN